MLRTAGPEVQGGVSAVATSRRPGVRPIDPWADRGPFGPGALRIFTGPRARGPGALGRLRRLDLERQNKGLALDCGATGQLPGLGIGGDGPGPHARLADEKGSQEGRPRGNCSVNLGYNS